MDEHVSSRVEAPIRQSYVPECVQLSHGASVLEFVVGWKPVLPPCLSSLSNRPTAEPALVIGGTFLGYKSPEIGEMR